MTTAENENDKLYIGRSLRNIGNTYWEFDKQMANDYYIRALEVSKEINDKIGMIKSISNTGNYNLSILLKAFAGQPILYDGLSLFLIEVG